MRSRRGDGYSRRYFTDAYLQLNRCVSTAAMVPFDYDAQHDPSPSTGDTVARAKRTSSERAAARRRYRAATDAAVIEANDDEAGDAPARAAQAARPGGGVARMGIVAALRTATRPLNVREDLLALPTLVRNKAFWIPALLTIAATVMVAAFGIKGTDPAHVVAGLLFQLFILTAPIGGPLVAGFLAPRASWLLGLILGVEAAIAYSLVALVFPLQVYTTVPDPVVAQNAVLAAFVGSPIMGAFFASAIAWYKRFLALSNPNRARRTQQAQKRVGDGRTRGSTGQKASTKAAVRR